MDEWLRFLPGHTEHGSKVSATHRLERYSSGAMSQATARAAISLPNA